MIFDPHDHLVQDKLRQRRIWLIRGDGVLGAWRKDPLTIVLSRAISLTTRDWLLEAWKKNLPRNLECSKAIKWATISRLLEAHPSQHPASTSHSITTHLNISIPNLFLNLKWSAQSSLLSWLWFPLAKLSTSRRLLLMEPTVCTPSKQQLSAWVVTNIENHLVVAMDAEGNALSEPTLIAAPVSAKRSRSFGAQLDARSLPNPQAGWYAVLILFCSLFHQTLLVFLCLGENLVTRPSISRSNLTCLEFE